MALDFKLNFDPDSPDALHERAAERIHTICSKNGSLYIKLAQSIAIQVRLKLLVLEIGVQSPDGCATVISQAAILPAPYRLAFGNLLDKAPGVSFDEVVKVCYCPFSLLCSAQRRVVTVGFPGRVRRAPRRGVRLVRARTGGFRFDCAGASGAAEGQARRAGVEGRRGLGGGQGSQAGRP